MPSICKKSTEKKSWKLYTDESYLNIMGVSSVMFCYRIISSKIADHLYLLHDTISLKLDVHKSRSLDFVVCHHFFKARFLNPNTIDILAWIILCYECLFCAL